jgi:hypothetical protein
LLRRSKTTILFSFARKQQRYSVPSILSLVMAPEAPIGYVLPGGDFVGEKITVFSLPVMQILP